MRSFIRTAATAMAAVAAGVLICAPPASAQAGDQSFFVYTGNRPLASLTPGTVLNTRTVSYHLLGVPTPLRAVQILYRTTNALGEPVANVTSVLTPPTAAPPRGVISYQSVYDSLNPADSPSRAVAGDFHILGLTPIGHNISDGNLAANGENGVLPAVLALGYAVNIPDTEGQHADFAAGPEYGMNTLDSLRAASTASATRLTENSKVGLVGYSGGAIASNWAAILAPGYAPDVNRRLVGVSEGGVLVNPARNLTYASGSLGWGGVTAMALVGISRSYHIDLSPYLSDYGEQVLHQLSDASILNAWYPGLTWQKLVKPQYANPDSVAPFVDVANKINMGTAPVPTVPMFIAQGSDGILEGTWPFHPGIGPGDGIMVAADVRALANRYCAQGLPVWYRSYDILSHTTVPDLWAPETVLWMLDRFAGKPAPSSCGSIAPGDPLSLAPQQITK